MRTFLSWKDVRKSAKDTDEKNGGGGGGNEQLDEFDIGGANVVGDPGLATGGPSVGTRTAKGNKKAKVGLPWDVSSFYGEQVPEREDEEDEDEEEMTTATLQRLKNADERTKGMTPDEYLHWSECRQASFTFRKGKRFREWAGFGVVTDSKPNDDIVDILGFLTFEIVQTLTEEALRVKAAEDIMKRDNGAANGGRGGGRDGGAGEDDNNEAGGEGNANDNDDAAEAAAAAGDEETNGNAEGTGGKRKRGQPGLFDPPRETRTPIGPKHVQDAFRRLQKPEAKTRYMSHLPGGPRRLPLKLVSLQAMALC